MLPNSFIIGCAKIKLDAIGSTNDFARDLLTKEEKIIEGTVVFAENQHGGRGQRGNNWISEPGKNVTFSIVLYPKFLAPSDQFELSKAISMGIVSYLREVLPVNMSAIRVKWPNDIYVGDDKICGILIENSISGSKLMHSVVGIGLNVNQQQFDDTLNNPTSMKTHADTSFDLDQVLNELCTYLDTRYIGLRNGDSQKTKEEYLENMYGYGELRDFEIDGTIHRASIIGVDHSGKLILDIENGKEVHCDLQEVSFT